MKAALLLLVLAAPRPGAAAAPSAPYRVVSVEGQLASGGKALRAGAWLQPGAKLALASGGRAVIALSGSGHVLLQGPAHLTLSGRRSKKLQLKLGRLLSLVAGGYEVETPAVVAAVRGTTFYVEARSRSETYLCVCDGTVAVSETGIDVGGFRAEIKTRNEHKASTFKFSEGGILSTDAGPMGHDDAEIAELAALPTP